MEILRKLLTINWLVIDNNTKVRQPENPNSYLSFNGKIDEYLFLFSVQY